MRTLEVTRRIPAPAQAIFDLLADHAGYARFRGISSSELLQEGQPPPNGAGAVRRIRSGPIRFDEDITAFERPSLLGYRIIRVNAPLEHEGGTIRLREDDGATTVEWTTTFRVPTPLIGGIQESIWVRVLRRSFTGILEDVERMVSEESAQ